MPSIWSIIAPSRARTVRKTKEQKDTHFVFAERGVATGLKEAPTEVGQTAMERWGARLPLKDEEARKEYLNSGAAGFGMGITTGGAGGVCNRVTGKPAPPEQDKKARNPPLTRTRTRLRSPRMADRMKSKPPRKRNMPRPH